MLGFVVVVVVLKFVSRRFVIIWELIQSPLKPVGIYVLS